MKSYAELLHILVTQYHEGRITHQAFCTARSRLLDAADAQYNMQEAADDHLPASDEDITAVQYPS